MIWDLQNWSQLINLKNNWSFKLQIIVPLGEYGAAIFKKMKLIFPESCAISHFTILIYMQR